MKIRKTCESLSQKIYIDMDILLTYAHTHTHMYIHWYVAHDFIQVKINIPVSIDFCRMSTCLA